MHIISAYFLAAASNKHMRLLTSLYGRYLNDNLEAPVFTEFCCSNKCNMLNGPT